MNRNKVLDDWIVQLCDEGIIYYEVDGYCVFDSSRVCGYLPSYALRYLADELDRMNQPWDDIINEFFESQENRSTE